MIDLGLWVHMRVSRSSSRFWLVKLYRSPVSGRSCMICRIVSSVYGK